jgi:predicted RNase H-like nuclease (RuvC/YqgF family)
VSDTTQSIWQSKDEVIADLKVKLKAAEAEVERVGRCNEQLSYSHAEQINHQNKRLAASETYRQGLLDKLAAAEAASRTESEHARIQRELADDERTKRVVAEAENENLRLQCAAFDCSLTEAESSRDNMRERLAAAEAQLARGLHVGCVLCPNSNGHRRYDGAGMPDDWWMRAKEVGGE